MEHRPPAGEVGDGNSERATEGAQCKPEGAAAVGAMAAAGSAVSKAAPKPKKKTRRVKVMVLAFTESICLFGQGL
jgi:hypothetical protein